MDYPYESISNPEQQSLDVPRMRARPRARIAPTFWEPPSMGSGSDPLYMRTYPGQRVRIWGKPQILGIPQIRGIPPNTPKSPKWGISWVRQAKRLKWGIWAIWGQGPDLGDPSGRPSLWGTAPLYTGASPYTPKYPILAILAILAYLGVCPGGTLGSPCLDPYLDPCSDPYLSPSAVREAK